MAARCTLFANGHVDDVLGAALNRADHRRTALRLLLDQRVERRMDLFDAILPLAFGSHADLALVHQVLEPLDRGWLSIALAQTVERVVSTDDWQHYRRLAELLEILHQRARLDDLVAAASRSNDDDILEVAKDFGCLMGPTRPDARAGAA